MFVILTSLIKEVRGFHCLCFSVDNGCVSVQWPGYLPGNENPQLLIPETLPLERDVEHTLSQVGHDRKFQLFSILILYGM